MYMTVKFVAFLVHVSPRKSVCHANAFYLLLITYFLNSLYSHVCSKSCLNIKIIITYCGNSYRYNCLRNSIIDFINESVPNKLLLKTLHKNITYFEQNQY